MMQSRERVALDERDKEKDRERTIREEHFSVQADFLFPIEEKPGPASVPITV